MPARLVICPVDVEIGPDGITRRRPRVGNITDPGKPPINIIDPDDGPITIVPKLNFTAAISDGQAGQENDFCLCLVAGVDLSSLDADPQITTLFDAGDDQPLDSHRAWLENTPRILDWSAGKINREKAKISSRRGDVNGLDRDTPLWEFVNRLAQRYSPGWDIRRSKTSSKGA